MTDAKHPRKVTAEQIRAVSAIDPLYAAGVQVFLQRGLWVIVDETAGKEV